ncbi:hypothetical protein ACSSVY_001996 [Roseovarius sp. MBR-51]
MHVQQPKPIAITEPVYEAEDLTYEQALDEIDKLELRYPDAVIDIQLEDLLR